jgi:antitoxin MazE
MQVQVAKWGNSLGVRVPRELAVRIGLAEGARMEMTAEGTTITTSVDRPVYTLDELLTDLTPEVVGGVWSWGPDVGREIVE